MITISLKIPDELNTVLDQVSQRRNVAKSEVVRVALEAYFSRASEKGQASCADLAGDLIGSLKGPVDLATNPKHIHGYGQ